jgi:competence protein ComEC
MLDALQLNIIVPVTVSYLLGALLAGGTRPDAAELVILTFLTLLLAAVLFFYRRHPGSLAGTLPLFFLLGFIHTGNGLRPPDDPAHVYNLVTAKSRVTVTGMVTAMPEFDGQTTRMEIDADSLLFHEAEAAGTGQIPARGRVRLSVQGDLRERLVPGSHLMTIASLSRTTGSQTPGVFDYRLYLANRSVYVSGRINSVEAILPYVDLSEPWYGKVFTYPELLRHRVAGFLESKLNPGGAALYKALLIGSRKGISEQTLENFKATGCMHLLAISGIHMSLLGMMAVFLFTWLMRRSTYLLNRLHVPTAATFAVLPLLFGYAFIAGMNTPVLRALIMSVFFLFGVVLRRQRSILPIIAAAALLVLILRPLAIFTASFQLSFSSVLAIALIYPRLLNLLERIPGNSRGKILGYAGAAILVSVAAMLGSLPFMLVHFNRFSPAGPFMNLLVEPFLCFWALPIGLIALPLAPISPELAALLLKTGSLGIDAAVRLTSLGSRIPFASLWTVTPDAIEIVLYYGIILLCFFSASIPGKRKTAAVLTVLFILYFTRGLWLSLPGKTTEIAFLDIGQGSSTFIRMPVGRKILVDGGSSTSSSFDAGENIIAPYLWKKKIWRLDEVIITHPHSDHYNGLPFVLRRFQPERIWINGHDTDILPYSSLLREASGSGIRIMTPDDAMLSIKDGEATLAALGTHSRDGAGPGGNPDLSVNDQSLVLKLRHGGYSFLLPGDIGIMMERTLIDEGADLEARVLLAPHHGSAGSGSREFLAEVDPEMIVVSAGRYSSGRYPAPRRLREWQADGRTVLETSRLGTITMRTDGRSLRVATHGLHPGVPPAGEPKEED